MQWEKDKAICIFKRRNYSLYEEISTLYNSLTFIQYYIATFKGLQEYVIEHSVCFFPCTTKLIDMWWHKVKRIVDMSICGSRSVLACSMI